MLKMMKYEYKRAMGPLMILFSIFALLEVYFLGSTAMKKEAHTAIATTLFIILSFACYLFVLVYGMLTYSKDLKNKEGYLVFMAPISSFKVLGAKLLSTLLTGITLVALIFLCGTIDYSFAAGTYHFDDLLTFFKIILEELGANPSAVVGTIFTLIVAFLIQFFMTTTLGYLAISLSATVLQNKKIKGFISFVVFFVLYGVVNVVAASLPNMKHLENMTTKVSTFDQLIYMLPQMGLYFVIMIICYLVSGLLLEKKISL